MRFVLAMIFFTSVAYAEDELAMDPEARARQAHDLSMSDMMYQQEDHRALYYQNLKIIDLLKEIRDEMHTANMRAAKEAK